MDRSEHHAGSAPSNQDAMKMKKSKSMVLASILLLAACGPSANGYDVVILNGV